MFHHPKEPEWRWLGGRAFWSFVAVVVVGLAAWFGRERLAIERPSSVPLLWIGGGAHAAGSDTVPFVVLLGTQDGRPIAGATVHVVARSAFDETQPVTVGTTDARGQLLGSFVPNVRPPLSLVATAQLGALEARDEVPVEPASHDRAGQVFVSTDKPLYRPGQTIRIRALAFGDDDKPIAGAAAAIAVATPDGTKVFEAKSTSSRFGLVSADFELADQVVLGSYRVSATIGKATAARTVDVKRYALPKLQIAFASVENDGKSVHGTVRASWVFGEPVAGADVNVEGVAGKTDADGAFPFAIDFASMPGLGELHATVDLAGVAASATLPVARDHGPEPEVLPETGERLVVRPDHVLYASGAPMKIEVLGALADEMPVGVWATSEHELLAATSCVARGGTCSAELTLPPRTTGFVGIQARTPATHGSRLVRVEGARDLDVTAEVHGTLVPGESVELALAARPRQGGIAEAAFGISIVDASVFLAARPDPASRTIAWADDDASAAALLVRARAAEPEARSQFAVAPPEVRVGWMKRAARDLWAAWLMLVPAGIVLCLFGILAAHTARRIVRSEHVDDANDGELLQWTLATRRLLVRWTLLLYLPPAVGLAVAAIWKSTGADGKTSAVIVASGVTTLLLAIALAGAIASVRASAIATAFPATRRVLWVLPAIALAGWSGIAALGADDFERVHDVIEAELLVPFAIVVPCFLAFGCIVVLRQTAQRRVAPIARVWLLASRSALLALPVVFLGLLLTMRIGARAAPYEATTAAPPLLDAPRVRADFPETLLWMPEVVAGSDGTATVRVRLADSITTWRADVSAVSAAGQVGQASVPIPVKQDFFVEASLPAYLTQGDEIALPVTVFNHLETKEIVRLELAGQPSQTVTLGPKETRGVRFVLRAAVAGTTKIAIAAIGTHRSDAIERTVEVLPSGYPVVAVASGALTKGASSVAIELPEGAVAGGNDLFVKVYDGVLGQIAEGLDGVFTMPHGCFEQTSSTTYPSLLALDFLRRTRSNSPALEARASRFVALGYQRLLSFEVPGGGFEWFGRAPSNTLLSAYGVAELSDMTSVQPVDPAVLGRTKRWLYDQATPAGAWPAPSHGIAALAETTTAAGDDLATAYIAWSLAESGDHDPRLERALDRIAAAKTVDPADDYLLAIRALALLAGGRDASPLVERLERDAVRADGGARWQSKGWGAMGTHGDGLEVELTALVAHALHLAKRSPELHDAALAWLATKRLPSGVWSTTPSTIAALRAMLDEAQPIAPGEGDRTVKISVDGRTAGTVVSKHDGVHRLLSLRDRATSGRHTVELGVDGGGDVAYQVVAVHHLPWETRPPPAKDAPLTFDVAWDRDVVQRGETVEASVHLRWTRADEAQMPVVEIGVPPGFEVVTRDLDRYVTSRDVSRYTVTESKITLYLDKLSTDDATALNVHLLATLPGRVVAPPSAAYLYYEPETRIETAPHSILTR